MFADVFFNLKLFWILLAFFNNSSQLPDIHDSRLSKAFKWSLAFEFFEGFCRRRFGIIIIALNAISFKGNLCNCSFIIYLLKWVDIKISYQLNMLQPYTQCFFKTAEYFSKPQNLSCSFLMQTHETIFTRIWKISW